VKTPTKAVGNSTAFAVAIAFFILQVYAGKWWMKHFYFGPVEWLWRSLTWFVLPPFRKKKRVNIESGLIAA